MARLAALLALAPLAAAQWANVCPVSGPTDAWNATACPAGATCCASGFSMSGQGCCPMPNAVCCPNGYACCPGGTTCVPTGNVTGYAQTYNCTPTSGSGPVVPNLSVCKPGPALPFSTTKKNVVVIGDSLSIGYTPVVAANLSDIALVQHSPWDERDGGAEETAYGLKCLPFFLASPSGISFQPDLVLFNWGMHDGPMMNTTWPGQNAPPTDYSDELEQIAQALVAYASSRSTKLAFATTTAYMCSEASNGCVQNLNNQARAIMSKYGIPVIDNYAAVIGFCGATVPNPACAGINNCFCPHCPGVGYEVLGAAISPVLRQMLTQA